MCTSSFPLLLDLLLPKAASLLRTLCVALPILFPLFQVTSSLPLVAFRA